MFRAVLALLGGALFLACASSKPGTGDDDGDGDAAVDVDASDTPPIDAPTDAMLKGFGEPCLDKAECASNICIFVGTGGRCTDLCGAGTCPADWGCFGVVDIIEPGSVHDVCVPVVDQLCSACSGDGECVQVSSADKCVTYPGGDRFCGRDCRTINCPAGYNCQDMSEGGTVIKQCVPTSGACDCDATNMGMSEACTIMTPFATTCAGTRTCQGATGWGACEPPSTTDDPDGSYQDANCDGIDGEVTRGIFVSVAGVDDAGCGLTAQDPCATINNGIVRAASSGRPNVYVQAGTYNEVLRLVSGVRVWGGYSSSWQRNSYSTAGHIVTVNGGLDNGVGGDNEYLTVRAHSLLAEVTIADMILVGPTASGTVNGDGKSSYVIHVEASLLRLERVRIVGGNGADGATGSAGADAVIVDAQSYMNGSGGGFGEEFTTACNNTSYGAGGAGGTNTCSSSPSTRAMNGGDGGRGGTMDTTCPCCNYDARLGTDGGDAAHRSGSFGEKGYRSTQTDAPCGAAADPHGNDGEVTNGLPGTRTTIVGRIASGYWYGRAGGAGGTGQNGGGGGGGGGGAGCDDGTDAYGAGAGGGGAGGCAARGGGGGGGGGGGSFGIFATGTGSTVTLDNVVIARGNAGDGGRGGTGGRGQSGGNRGGPGASPGSADPGYGGFGGHGGHGGGGAGGNGGRAVGIAFTSGVTISPSTVTYSGGSAGSAGLGGQHAPTAPAAQRDGSDGPSGTAGTLDTTRQCASATDC